MTDQTAVLHELTNTELQPIIKELFTRRNRLRVRIALSTIIIVPITLFVGYFLVRFLREWGLTIALATASFCWYAINAEHIAAYKARFKAEVMPRLLKITDPNRTYRADDGIGQSEFTTSGLYLREIDRYNCEDYFTGKIGATAFRFSEVNAEYKIPLNDGDGLNYDTWHTIFKGLFFVADFNKHFQGKTYVLPDNIEGLGGIGRWFQEMGGKMESRDGELIKLEDPEFEQIFAVYTTDPVEARYILSTSLMQRLSAFRKQVNEPIAISFVNSNIYIAIPSKRDYFEPPPLWWGSGILSVEMLKEHMRDIKLAEAVVQELNLNLRIWTKQ